MSFKKLTAILFADISGYTAMMQRDEKSASESLRRFQSQLEEEVIRHHGQVANFYGDGALCLFEIPAEAVKAAIALQQAFLQVPKIPVRMGLHMGTVTHDNGKVFGDSVNITSRIESMAPPGSILLSKKIRDDIKNDPSMQMVSLGNYQFKNVQEPVELFTVNAEGLIIPNRKDLERGSEVGTLPKFWIGARWVLPFLILGGLLLWYFVDQEPAAKIEPDDKKSLAVLPLVNLNSKEENLEYFSDGITNEIIDELAQIKSLSLTAFTTSLMYKNNQKPIDVVANELQVDYIVAGSSRIQQTGDSVVMSIELINPKSQKRIWNGRYTETMQDAPSIQLSIARQIAESLEIDLSTTEQQSLSKANTFSGEAFRLFLQAKGEINKLNVEGLDMAEKYLLDAISIDPNYAQAYTLLAWNYVLQGWQWFWRGHISIDEGRARVKANINRALQLDPESSDIFLVSANFEASLEADLVKAVEDVETALEINSWPEIPTNYCVCTAVTNHVIAGNLERAKELASLALEVDPGNIFIFHDQGIIYMREDKWPQAQAMFQKALDGFDIPIFRFLVGWSLYHDGQFDESVSHFEHSRINDTLAVGIHLAYLSNAYFRMGNAELSTKYRTMVTERYKNGNEALNVSMAIISSEQGDNNETLTYLERAYDNRDPMTAYLLNIDPLFDRLINEPRFKEIRRKMGYYETATE